MRRFFPAFACLFMIIGGFLVMQAFEASAQILQKGSSGKSVADLQQFLSAYSSAYPEKIVNGYFGPKTEAGVKRFQKLFDIPQTGVVGTRTQKKITELKTPLSKVAQPKTQETAPPILEKKSAPLVNQDASSPSQTKKGASSTRLAHAWSRGNCVGSGSKTLTSPPVRLDDILYIEPMGAMSGSHVTPVDHLYFHGKKIDGNRFDVLSPADGFVVEVGIVPGPDDYRIILEHSCTFYTIYIHVTTLSKKVGDAIGNASLLPKPKQIRVPVKAGEAIGEKIVALKKGATQVDVSIANSEVVLTGFVVPEHYDGEVWKIHTVDPYQYYLESLKNQLIAKTNRSKEPIAGKIDYDIDGRLVGNWFIEGTNGYEGDQKKTEYWSTHMTIAYDYHDPTKIRVSVGDWNGESKQFAVRHNAPDPKNVEIATGAVKYELIRTQYIRSSGTPWDWSGIAKDITLDLNTDTEGTMLVELLAPRTLKMEIFPGLPASQVTGFTTRARIYER